MKFISRYNSYRDAGLVLQLNLLGTIGPAILLAFATIECVEYFSNISLGIVGFSIHLGVYSFAFGSALILPLWGVYYLHRIRTDYGPKTLLAVKEMIFKGDKDIDIEKIALSFRELPEF